MSVAGPDVGAAELEIVKDILGRLVPGRAVWAFGSRVNGRSKKFSDLDLILVGEEALPLGVLGDLADAFAESDLPYKVDVVEWATASESFRRWWLRGVWWWCEGAAILLTRQRSAEWLKNGR